MPDIAGEVVAYLPGLSNPLRVNAYGFAVQAVDYRDDPAHDDAWVDREAAKYGGRGSVWWRQNYEMELVRGGQPVWPMLSRDVHLRTITRAELLSASWSIYRGLDHGIRHPTCCAWAAINQMGDLYVYRQYYETDRTIAHNVKAILQVTPGDEYVHGNVADPSLWSRSAETLEPWAEVYRKQGLMLLKADNAARGYENLTSRFVASIAKWAVWNGDLDRLRSALSAPTLTLGDADRLARQPAIWFSPEVAQGPRSLYEECVNFRWRVQTGDPTQRAAPSAYVDVDDEGPDVTRYLAQSGDIVRWRSQPAARDTGDLLMKVLTHDRHPVTSALD